MLERDPRNMTRDQLRSIIMQINLRLMHAPDTRDRKQLTFEKSQCVKELLTRDKPPKYSATRWGHR